MTVDRLHRPRILIIDDDRELAAMLSDFLGAENLDVEAATTGESGLSQLQARNFDLVILDVMLPGIDGFEVLKRLRQSNDIAVIMLTARGDDIDRIVGLEVGADDYLPKPFNPRELLARIKAILRRAGARSERGIEKAAGPLRLDPKSRKVSVRERPLRLTGTEFEILDCLIENQGDVVSRDRLSERALGRRLLPYDRSIDTHISNLRGKLERAGLAPDTIQNRRGIGYVLVAPSRG